jgi:hypothetical protein
LQHLVRLEAKRLIPMDRPARVHGHVTQVAGVAGH